MVKFKDFSRPLSVFQVLFKANVIFKDFSRQSCIVKYFSSMCEPCQINGHQQCQIRIFTELSMSSLGHKVSFCFFLFLYVPVNNVLVKWTGLPGLNQYKSEDKVSCSRTQHSDSAGSETRTSNPSITSPTLYQLSHCAPP